MYLPEGIKHYRDIRANELPDPDPNLDPDPNPNPNPDLNPDPDPDRNPDPNLDPDPNPNPNPNPDPNPDLNPDPDPDRMFMASITEHGHHGNRLVNILHGRSHQHDEERNVLALNVLLLGDRQSGRSSVGNALIGGHEFQTGTCISGVSVTTECQVLRRNFPRYFRRQGAESDLKVSVIDTPPLLPRPQSLHELCPGGVHVLALVVRADLSHENTHLGQRVESLFGPEWRRHALLILTHADHLKRAGLPPAGYLTRAADWLGALANEVAGGVSFLDNSRDWPSVRGRPLRDRMLRLSAGNHHTALRVRTEV
ncbi:GTPase IMAP family member GIMD1-like [Xiphias gladius]|uniref:GTPase IMAP family member GIMD1-like n=1 Tax=Xiphias gladius TaxID=8245 RepID=UPI001A97E4A5|nr:GTPase IMAP family member GIMD1-like [Xiphias gladius]